MILWVQLCSVKKETKQNETKQNTETDAHMEKKHTLEKNLRSKLPELDANSDRQKNYTYQ